MSQILSSISNGTSLGSQDAVAMLASTTSTLDVAFLRGGSAELGIKPLIPVDPKADIDFKFEGYVVLEVEGNSKDIADGLL